jgi:hypothetical protein
MNNAVISLAAYGGELIAGGGFSLAGGVNANRIARWDGMMWHPLGSGMDGGVAAFTVYQGDLIAGGYFTTAGTVSANLIGRWNGVSWQPLDSGMSGNYVSNYVGALTTVSWSPAANSPVPVPWPPITLRFGMARPGSHSAPA